MSQERLRLLPTDMCDGKLAVLFADESSWHCTRCGWMGWPQQDVDVKTGVILHQYPHPYTAPLRDGSPP